MLHEAGDEAVADGRHVFEKHEKKIGYNARNAAQMKEATEC